MLPDIFVFYMLFFLILSAAAGIVFAPRMYLSLLSFFVMICASSALYLTLNASYLAVFQFILCAIVLCVYIFLLLRKIGRLNLKLKLVSVFKVFSGCLFTFLLGGLTYLFFSEEYSSSLYSIFNFITEKSSDIVNFSKYAFPLHLVIILLLVATIVIRVFLANTNQGGDA